MSSIPTVIPIEQILNQPRVTDPATAVRRAWESSAVPRRLARGDRVAVAVGSRGIANIQTIVRHTLRTLEDFGAKPFVVAAMGSHGGATADGQRDLLASYGITEPALGVPVMTDMDAVVIGHTPRGEPVFWDRNALAADAVVTVSRVKPHTDYRGRYESGIVKMLVIGLGKRDGASQHHRYGVRGLCELLPESARVVIEKTKFLGGLAVIENAREQTARLQVLDRDHVLDEEPALLQEARDLMGRLPFDRLDLLVIGEIGKNYSGAGIDPNVVGRLLVEGEPEFEKPRITRICCLDLSPESHGNGTGVGIADLTTQRLLQTIDQVPFRMNNLTACFLWRSKLPFAFPTDRECIEAGLATCWQPEPAAIRLAIIPNTLQVNELWVSPALLDEARASAGMSIIGPAEPLPFDNKGNLMQEKLFPRSVRGRRGETLH